MATTYLTFSITSSNALLSSYKIHILAPTNLFVMDGTTNNCTTNATKQFCYIMLASLCPSGCDAGTIISFNMSGINPSSLSGQDDPNSYIIVRSQITDSKIIDESTCISII